MTPPLSKELQEQIEREAEAHYGSPLSCDQGYIMGANTYAALLQDSERRRNEANALLFPLLDYGQSKEANIPWGASITTVILQRAKRFEEARKALEEIADLSVGWDVKKAIEIASKALASWKEEGKDQNDKTEQ